jgi:myo-inositol 2-dehydrogenase / D-chiro-inositol 1-dehydrogenase
MKARTPRRIGLAIVGAGRIGLIRGEIAARHGNVEWIGVAETRADRGKDVATRIGADFVTTDHRELLARSEVNAAIIATDEHLHVDPILAAVERKIDLLIEKPLATDLAESARVLAAIERAGVDAVVGYTQRFRRRFLGAKEKIRTGQLGEVTLVTSRAFMNRLVAIDNYRRTDRPETISPMVISGTHALDVVMWLLEGKTPVEAYARSVDRVLGPTHRGIDATAGLISMSDGTLYHLNISWALPVVWPGSVYSLEIGVVGTDGVLTVDDTHRDVVLATRTRRPRATRPRPSATSISSAAFPPATWPWASCGVPCARRRMPGSRASRSVFRHPMPPQPRLTTG